MGALRLLVQGIKKPILYTYMEMEGIKELVTAKQSWSTSRFFVLYSSIQNIVNLMDLPVGTNTKWAWITLVHSLMNSTESRPAKGIYSVALPHMLISDGEKFTARLNVTLSNPGWHWEFKEVMKDDKKHIHAVLVPLDDDNGKKIGECIATIVLTDVNKVVPIK